MRTLLIFYLAIIATISVFSPKKEVNIYITPAKAETQQLIDLPKPPPITKDFFKQWLDPAFPPKKSGTTGSTI